MKKNKKISLICLILVLILLLIGTLFILVKKNTQEVKIAFVEMPQNVQSVLVEQINSVFEKKVKFSFISTDEFNKSKLKKFDYVFCVKGNAILDREEEFIAFPKEWYKDFPTAVEYSSEKEIPILLNHYELNYNKDFFNEEKLNYPRSFAELQNSLYELKEYVFLPFYCTGGDDRTLLALLSCFVESLGGSLGYNQFIKNLQESDSFAENLEKEIYKYPNSSNVLTLKTILDGLIVWQKNEILHSNWYEAKPGDLNVFLEMNQIGVFFESFYNHREINPKLIRNYDTDRFPVLQVGEPHGVIQPVFVCVKTSNKKQDDENIRLLTLAEKQYYLSVKTKLAPVNSSAQCYDKQADDVRFLAAACSDGPMPDIYNAVFQGKEDKAHVFAQAIRQYLKQSK